MSGFELAPDQGFVTKPSDFVGIGDRIDIHAVLGQRLGQSKLISVPKQSTGANQDEAAGLSETSSQIQQPVLHLAGMFQLASWHVQRQPEYSAAVGIQGWLRIIDLHIDCPPDGNQGLNRRERSCLDFLLRAAGIARGKVLNEFHQLFRVQI